MIKYKEYYIFVYQSGGINEDIYASISMLNDNELLYSFGCYCENNIWTEPNISIRHTDQKFPVPDKMLVSWHNREFDKTYEHQICLKNQIVLDNDILIVGITSIGELCSWIKTDNNCSLIYNSTIIGSPIYNHMKQYKYKLNAICADNGNDNVFRINKIKVSRSDGTRSEFNSIVDEFDNFGIPRKFSISFDAFYQYSAYFFFDCTQLYEVFERFYGAHPETKADFIIRIDAENKKYELALYRQGLKEPVVIPESAYQLIVFKNKFEHYRSENYDQPRGAWIW